MFATVLLLAAHLHAGVPAEPPPTRSGGRRERGRAATISALLALALVGQPCRDVRIPCAAYPESVWSGTFGGEPITCRLSTRIFEEAGPIAGIGGRCRGPGVGRRRGFNVWTGSKQRGCASRCSRCPTITPRPAASRPPSTGMRRERTSATSGTSTASRPSTPTTTRPARRPFAWATRAGTTVTASRTATRRVAPQIMPTSEPGRASPRRAEIRAATRGERPSLPGFRASEDASSLRPTRA